MFVTKNFSCSIFNQVHLSSRSNWRENSRGKSRGTKDTDPRAIRALSSRIVGLEFRDNWNGDDNATRSRRKIRAGMGVGTANTDYSPPLLYHPSAQKKITIFPLHPAFFPLPIIRHIESVRVEEARWFRGGRLDSNAAGISKTERERGEDRSNHSDAGQNVIVSSILSSPGICLSIAIFYDLFDLFQKSHNIAFCRIYPLSIESLSQTIA